MSFSVPLQYLGDGQFQAMRGHAKRCDKELTIGEVLTWEEIKARSMNSHRHYFASVHDAWLNLPEAIAGQFPTEEYLRKYALCKSGFCTMQKIVCSTEREAMQASGILHGMDTFAICEVNVNIVTIWRAESQSLKAMGKDRFQKSKTAVLEYLESLIGASLEQAA
jgi:hypothetical protein